MKDKLPNRLIYVLICGLAPWIFGISCAANGGRQEQRVVREPAPTMSWEVKVGSRGGFTGGGGGHLIQASGEVYSWTQATAANTPTTKLLGRATSQTIQALAQTFTAPDLLALQYRETGNMTGFLEWRHNGQTREYSWPEPGGMSPLPPPLQRVRDAIEAVIVSVHP